MPNSTEITDIYSDNSSSPNGFRGFYEAPRNFDCDLLYLYRNPELTTDPYWADCTLAALEDPNSFIFDAEGPFLPDYMPFMMLPEEETPANYWLFPPDNKSEPSVYENSPPITTSARLSQTRRSNPHRFRSCESCLICRKRKGKVSHLRRLLVNL